MAGLGLSTQITGAFARVNPRERKLLAALGLIVLVMAPLKAFDMRAGAVAENEAAQAQLAQVMVNAKRASGQGLSTQLAKTREEVADWSWPAPSPAVGQVIAQDALMQMAASGGLAGAEVRALGRPQTAGAATMVGVEVTAPFSWTGLSGFLSGLSASGKGFVLESVTKTDDKEPKVRIHVRLPIVIEEPATA